MGCAGFKSLCLCATVLQCMLQIADKEERLAALRAAAAPTNTSGHRHTSSGILASLQGLAGTLAGSSGESEQAKVLMGSMEGLRVMEATLAADVAEMAAERARAQVCFVHVAAFSVCVVTALGGDAGGERGRDGG